MKLSVVIPTYNRRAVIEKTLPTVLDQTFPANKYEVVVVVDGSTDGTTAVLKNISSKVLIRVIEQENRGQAAARNAGIKAATGELVLFLDDDIFCERTLLSEHAAAHDGRDFAVFGPVLVAPQSPENLATKWVRQYTREHLSRMEKEGVLWPADYKMDANSSVGRDLLVMLGGFDERFFQLRENAELGLRLWQAGVRFKFCPTAVTSQLYVKSTDFLVSHDAALYGANEVLLCRKHPEYRRHSQFGHFNKGTWLKRKWRELSMRMPFSLDPLLMLAERAVQANPRMGIRFFNARQQLGIYRGAIKPAGGWRQFKRDYGAVLPVLMYHRIGPDMPGTYPGLTVEPGRFRKQMTWLRRNGYTTIRTDDWLAWQLVGKPLPSKPVLITFDDAYEELVEYAFPVLRENGFTATVFVVTGEVGGRNSWDVGKWPTALKCMGEEQIRRWSAQGMEFGAHSRTHADLTTLSSPRLEEEIEGSGRDLAGILGGHQKSFAYPFGGISDAVKSLVGKAFQIAFTCEEGLNHLGTEPLLLRRTMVLPGDSLPEFGLRVRFGFNPIDRWRARVRLRSRFKGLLMHEAAQ